MGKKGSNPPPPKGVKRPPPPPAPPTPIKADIIKNHPAKYSDIFIPIFADALAGCKNVYDPMAGTGKIAKIREYGFSGGVFCTEIEPEWSSQYEGVDHWHIGDAMDLDVFKSGYFDAICTSPTYGNRMADHYSAKDKSKRFTYRACLGRPLHDNNTGRMQWGVKYRATHLKIYAGCRRVLKNKGLFILNMSDHIRSGERVPVTDWHKKTLLSLGLLCVNDQKIKTPRMGFGANGKLRVDHERVLMFVK